SPQHHLCVRHPRRQCGRRRHLYGRRRQYWLLRRQLGWLTTATAPRPCGGEPVAATLTRRASEGSSWRVGVVSSRFGHGNLAATAGSQPLHWVKRRGNLKTT